MLLEKKGNAPPYEMDICSRYYMSHYETRMVFSVVLLLLSVNLIAGGREVCQDLEESKPSPLTGKKVARL
jgi:hypothetical protein